MVIPELKFLFPVIGDDESIDDLDFWIPVEADIGPVNSEGAEIFLFYITSPKRLGEVLKHKSVVIGKGLLILEKWNEEEIKKAILSIINDCKAETWKEVVSKLCKYSHWEYEGMDYMEK